jgi:uncharacterized protein YggE
MTQLHEIRNIFLIVIGGLLIALLVHNNGFSTVARAQTNQPTENSCVTGRSISVTGSATVNVTPDRAMLRLGVETDAATPSQAQTANQNVVRQVTAAIRQLGIPEKEIATTLFSVFPIYDNNNSKVTSYRVANQITLNLTDVSKVNPVLIAALNAGANQVVDLQLYTSQMRKFRDDARALAIKAASEKAQALASGVGAQVGCAININEGAINTYNPWNYWSAWRGSAGVPQMAQNVVQNAPQPATPSTPTGDMPIVAGQFSVTADVSVTFSLR